MKEKTPKASKNQKEKRQSLLIVLGNTEEIIIEFLQETIQSSLGNKYNLELIATNSGDTILEIAKQRKADLYIIMTNNLYYESNKIPGKSFIDQSLALIKTLREQFNTPVIAISGLSKTITKAIRAGASYSFGCPFNIQEMANCIKNVLQIK